MSGNRRGALKAWRVRRERGDNLDKGFYSRIGKMSKRDLSSEEASKMAKQGAVHKRQRTMEQLKEELRIDHPEWFS